MGKPEYLFDLSTFDDDQLARLCDLKDQYEQPTPDERRLRFARWLVEHGVLSEWDTGTSTASAEPF